MKRKRLKLVTVEEYLATPIPDRFIPKWWWSKLRRELSAREWQRDLWEREKVSREYDGSELRAMFDKLL